MKTRAFGMIAINLGAKAACFLPPRVARLALDTLATVVFGSAKGVEFTNTRGERVTL